jgi:hypothetical protein
MGVPVSAAASGGLGDRLHDVTISGDLRRTRLAVLA